MGRPTNDDVYGLMENGGDVYDDIADLTYDELEEYFGDQDPCAFL